jgi:STE24 endopeptidase
LASAETLKAADFFSPDEVQTAARYNNKLYTLFAFKEVTLLGFLALTAFSGLGAAYGRDVGKILRGRQKLVLPAYAFFLVLMIRLAALPFDAVRDLGVKKSFGLFVEGAGGWLADQAKSFFVADLWYVPFVVILFALMRRFRRSWWLLSAVLIGIATIAWCSLAPHLIEPLFFKITPIQSEALHSQLDPLLHQAGLDPGVLYEADSGRKTKEVNAYLSGLFLGRRIVLYNVLEKEAEPSELRFVVAHEVAHLKRNHVIKGIAFRTAGAAGVLLLIGALLKLTTRKARSPDANVSMSESLPAFFFYLNVILFLTMPIEAALSRRIERAADAYALELTQDPEGAARLFEKVARKNLSDLNPPPLARFWLHTHPPILERIEEALRRKERFNIGGDSERTTVPAKEKPSEAGATDKTPTDENHSRGEASHGSID